MVRRVGTSVLYIMKDVPPFKSLYLRPSKGAEEPVRMSSGEGVCQYLVWTTEGMSQVGAGGGCGKASADLAAVPLQVEDVAPETAVVPHTHLQGATASGVNEKSWVIVRKEATRASGMDAALTLRWLLVSPMMRSALLFHCWW